MNHRRLLGDGHDVQDYCSRLRFAVWYREWMDFFPGNSGDSWFEGVGPHVYQLILSSSAFSSLDIREFCYCWLKEVVGEIL